MVKTHHEPIWVRGETMQEIPCLRIVDEVFARYRQLEWLARRTRNADTPSWRAGGSSATTGRQVGYTTRSASTWLECACPASGRVLPCDRPLATVHIQSFLKVTGSKTDVWLVKTLGVLISVIGVVLGMTGVQQSVTREMALLGVGSAAGLTAIEVIYVARRRIAPVYLLDAVAELALLIGWGVGSRTP